MNEKETLPVDKPILAPLIFARISAVMRDIKAVAKDQRNEQQKFMFRGIEGVLNNVQAAMAKHEVFVTQRTISSDRKDVETVTSYNGKEQIKKFIHCVNEYCFKFWTVDGSYIETFHTGEGIDYGDKSANKCSSIALKYALINTLLIPTKDLDDPDAESHEVVRQLSQTTSQAAVRTPQLQQVQQQQQSVAPQARHQPVVQPAKPVVSPDRMLAGDKMAAAFKSEFGIDRSVLESFIGCRIAEVGDNEISRLRDCYGRLKAGEASNVVFMSPVISDLF
jgi:hypothetical protein